MDIYEIRRELQNGKTIYDLPLRVTYYARVSTDKEEQRHSLAAQVAYYEESIRRNPAWEAKPGYVDKGISGTSVEGRQQFLKMIADADDNQFDFILTKEISRFSRNTLDSIRYTQELLRCGVGVLFQSDNINTLLPDAELRLTIMSSIAQDEVRKTSERVRFGFRRAIEKGVVLGSSRIWGYQKKGGRLVICEEEAEMVRLIYDLYANQQLGIRGVAAVLTERGYFNSNGNPFSFSTIRGILTNPKYKGFYCGGKTTKVDYKLKEVKTFSPSEWVIYEDREHVPPIVSPALWEKANTLLQSRHGQQKSKGRGSRYLYSGKIFCGEHRAPYYRGAYHYPTGNKEVWRCREYVKNGREGCQMPSLYTEEINRIIEILLGEREEEVKAAETSLLSCYQACLEQGKPLGSVEKNRAEQELLHHRKDQLLDLRMAGQLSDAEFLQRNTRFNEQLQKLEEEAERLIEAEAQCTHLQRNFQELSLAAEKFLSGENLLSLGVVDALVDHLTVYRTEQSKLIRVETAVRSTTATRYFLIRRQRGGPSVCTEEYT